MKRLLLSLSVVMLLVMTGTAAFAQGADDFNKELQAFQKKTGSGVGDNVAAPAAPAASASTDASAATAEGSLPVAHTAPAPVSKNIPASKPVTSNPLGPAGDLPLGKQLPATANALNMQVPVETQQQMEADAAAQKEKMEQATFNDAMKELLPLKPEEIRKVLDNFKESRRASETPISDPVP